MKKTTFKHIFQFLTLLAAPIVAAPALISCGESSGTKSSNTPSTTPVTPTGALNLASSQKLSVDELNSIAAQIPGENNTPWRRGVAYEAGSQALSLMRAVAYKLGWSESLFATTRPLVNGRDVFGLRSSKVYIPDGSLNLSTNEILSATQATNDTANAKVVEDYKKFRARTDIKPFEKLNSYLGIGDDAVVGDTDPVTEAFISADGFPWASYTEATVPSATNLSNLSKMYFSSWADSEVPGDMMVQISQRYVTRLIRVPGGSYIYPVISNALFESDFLPMIRNLIKTFISFDLSSAIASVGSLVPHETIGFLWHVKSQAPTDEQLNTIIRSLNNGSHHLLALAGVYRGYDASFVNTTNVNSVLSKFTRGTGITSWLDNQAVKGLSAEASTFNDLINFGRFNQVNSATYGFLSRDPLATLKHLSYFTNRPTLNEQLLANNVIQADYSFIRALMQIRFTSSAPVTFTGTQITLPTGFSDLKFAYSNSPVPSDAFGSISSVTLVSANPLERFLWARFTFGNETYTVDLTNTSGIRLVA